MEDKQTILFLGDSLTDYGVFHTIVESYLVKNAIPNNYSFINAGLGWETCCGLTEGGIPAPRPCVSERLDRVIAAIPAPTWTIILYGVNDGIFSPFEQNNFAKYQAGIKSLVNRFHALGSKVALLTPAPFDKLSAKGTLFPIGEEQDKYGCFHLYDGYDEVMRAYSEWILSCDIADKVIDIRSPLLAELKRGHENKYVVSLDGIHYNERGGIVIANAILKDIFGIDANIDITFTKTKVYKLILKRNVEQHRAWKAKIGHTSLDIDKVMPTKKLDALVAKINKKLSKWG